MKPALDNLPSKDVAADSVRQTNDPPSRSTVSAPRQEETLIRNAAVLLALLPGASFLGQLGFSYQAGIQQVMFHHFTVMIVDWVFVPFNFFAVRVIEWRRGGRLYLIACISVVLSVLTHAFWQYNGLDPGYMVTKAGVFLPAGWVHLVFSTLEMVLLAAFVFCRKANASRLGVTTMLATRCTL